jgi:hypothetical protein
MLGVRGFSSLLTIGHPAHYALRPLSGVEPVFAPDPRRTLAHEG